ncbi:MAG: mechanosensitive ion channel family protein [Lachnospiraceae bacterium]|nr:mechanosensitive ion channel family protein [Lachnospiraceae bacterium]
MKEFFQLLSKGDFPGAMAIFAAVALRVVFAFVLWWIARKVIRRVSSWIEKGLEIRQSRGMDGGLAKFLLSLCKVGMYTVLFAVLFELLGLPITSVATIIGSAGLAIGLALQGSLSNFAGGVLILLTKPFRLGDYIVASGMEGTVKDIGICYTRLVTTDNRTVILPNGSLANSNLINVSAEPERRVDITVPISYDDDIREVREMLLALAAEEQRILTTRSVEAYVKEFGDSSLNMVFRCWVKKENYWPVYFSMMEAIRYAMKERGFTIPFPQVDVHTDSPAG